MEYIKPRPALPTRPAHMTSLQSIRYDLRRFRAWRIHRDEAFKVQYQGVQQWRAQRLRDRHQNLLDDPRYARASRFVLSRMYGGVDLVPLARDMTRVVPIVSRIVPESILQTIAVALELNAVTGELDQRLTEVLFEDMRVSAISPESYCVAFVAAAPRELRERQLHLMVQLGHHLDRYVRSRFVQRLFSFLSTPMQMAGLYELHDFISEGFKVMRPMGSADDFIQLFVTKEQLVIENIWLGRPNPLMAPELEIVAEPLADS